LSPIMRNRVANQFGFNLIQRANIAGGVEEWQGVE
jgi:hypothetical protein